MLSETHTHFTTKSQQTFSQVFSISSSSLYIRDPTEETQGGWRPSASTSSVERKGRGAAGGQSLELISQHTLCSSQMNIYKQKGEELLCKQSD